MRISEMISELNKRLKECGDVDVTISVDISTGEHDADARVLAEPIEIMQGPDVVVISEKR